jgi:hypothetical protein
MDMAPYEGVLTLAARLLSGDRCISLERPRASGAALRCHKAAPICYCTLVRQHMSDTYVQCATPCAVARVERWRPRVGSPPLHPLSLQTALPKERRL